MDTEMVALSHSLVAELTGQKLVLDGGVTCRLTLRMSGVHWETALEHSLKACGLASEMDEGVLRVAPAQRLIEERRQERALQGAQRRARPAGPIRVPLSYARAGAACHQAGSKAGSQCPTRRQCVC